MSNQSRGRKKSQFVGQSTIAGTDTLDFVTGSTNRKITFTEFLAALGVTGTIVAKGSATGTPILNKAGSVNEIRTLENGPGVKASVSAEGGAKLEHNFAQGATGTPILVDETTLQPAISNLLAGTGITLVANTTNNTIEIIATAATANVVEINSLSDLPSPVLKDGVMTIILEEKEYILINALSSANPLAPPIGGKTATWQTVNRAKWTKTGTGACFRDKTANGFIELRGQNDFSGSGGDAFDVDTVSGTWGIQGAELSRFKGFKSLGKVSGGASGNGAFNLNFGTLSDFYDGLIMENLFFTEQNTMFAQPFDSAKLDYDGQTVNFTLGETVTGGTSGATGVVQIDTDNGADGTLVLSAVSGVFQNDEALTGSSTGVAVVDGVLQNVVIFTVQGTATTGIVSFDTTTVRNLGANQAVYNIKPEIEPTVDSINLIHNMKEGTFNGVAFETGSMDVDDAKVQSAANTFIAETRPDGLLSMQGNATETIIAIAGTPVLVAGTWVVERTSQMTGTTEGRLTYDVPIKPATLPITYSLTVEPASGGSVSVSAEVLINGAPVPNSKRTSTAAAGSPTSITIPWQDVFTQAKFVEVAVTNEDTTVNLLVSSGIARVN